VENPEKSKTKGVVVNNNSINSSLIVLVCLLLASCAGYTTRVSTDDAPTGKEAYLYGRFYIDAPKLNLSLGGHQSMGFSIKCQDDLTYVIRFYQDDPLHVIKVAPSTCSLNEIVYTDGDGMVKSRKPVQKGLMDNAVFAPGKAYYLGDFAAKSTREVTGNMIYTSWNITEVKDNYELTTSQMKKTFVKLANLPTEDRMIGAKPK
jgi:hypothetical protein